MDEDIKPVRSMTERCALLEVSALPPIDKAMMLLSDCRRFGALALAHAARAGFVATSFLKSFVTLGALTEVDKLAFLKTIKTVASEFERDGMSVSNGQMSKKEYVERYGHLRPGTYDATVEAYWEAPERYLFSKHKSLSNIEKDFHILPIQTEIPPSESALREKQIFLLIPTKSSTTNFENDIALWDQQLFQGFKFWMDLGAPLSF